MSTTQTRAPEWREHPSAVAEAVFYIGLPQTGAGPDGKYRFAFSPMWATDSEARSVYAKGDYVPDFDYARAFGEVYMELAFALQEHIPLENFDDGDVLVRFVAFKRLDEWSIEGPDSVISTLESLQLNTFEFTSGTDTSRATDMDDRDREVMLGELAAVHQLQGDLSPELIQEHAPRSVDEYKTAFGSLTDAVDVWEEKYGHGSTGG